MIKIKIGNSELELVKGDITKQDTEAVVNAANKRLAPGGGVAGSIHRVAGAYNLPNKFVIHTVGPVYSGSKTDSELLKNSYLNSLKLTDENGIKSMKRLPLIIIKR